MRSLTERGVTLLELLLAMFLLATALLGLGASFPYAMYGVTSGGYQTQASLMGEQCLDVARNMQIDTLVAIFNTSTPPDKLSAQCPPMTGGFKRQSDGQLNGSLLTITVIIEFPEPTGITQTTLATIRAR